MTGTQTVRRTTTRARRDGSMQLLRGLGAAMLTTIIVVAVFALLMQWVKPTEDTVRIFNQLLKVVSVAIGTYIAVGRGQEGGLLRGALIGLLYMALGVAAYALLTERGVEASYGELAPCIRTRKGDGPCPMEQAVADLTDPADAPAALRRKLAELRGGK